MRERQRCQVPLLGRPIPSTRQEATVGNGSMTAFLAESRAAVDAFHAAALLYGGTDEGPPGIRPFHEEFLRRLCARPRWQQAVGGLREARNRSGLRD